MAIEIGRDELLTLSQAAKFFPRDKSGKPISPGAVWRWAQPWHVPQLETIRMNRTYYTTRQALQAFARACAGDVDPPPKLRSRAERERAIEETDRKLKAAGIG